MAWLAAAFACASVIAVARASTQAAPAPAVPTQAPAADYTNFVGTYCVTCHNDRLKTAGLSLQNLDLANVPAHARGLGKGCAQAALG